MTCPCLPRHAINPRICYGSDNVRRLVYDCGICGQRDVVDAADPRQDSADVLHGGPLADSLIPNTIGGR